MILMAFTLGKIFKRGGKSVRYVYSGGKRQTKRLVTKVTSKKFMKKTARTILVGGVWYIYERAVGNTKKDWGGSTAAERKISRRSR
jgi:hypothetical protein